jgi:hypothetical protein
MAARARLSASRCVALIEPVLNAVSRSAVESSKTVEVFIVSGAMTLLKRLTQELGTKKAKAANMKIITIMDARGSNGARAPVGFGVGSLFDMGG